MCAEQKGYPFRPKDNHRIVWAVIWRLTPPRIVTFFFSREFGPWPALSVVDETPPSGRCLSANSCPVGEKMGDESRLAGIDMDPRLVGVLFH